MDQLSIPMPIAGHQVTVVREPGHGWIVAHYVRRDGSGWCCRERWSGLDHREALEVAFGCLALDD